MIYITVAVQRTGSKDTLMVYLGVAAISLESGVTFVPIFEGFFVLIFLDYCFALGIFSGLGQRTPSDQ